jgi:prepilin-type N-terminal cleavage/methylation domain-containing protein
LKAGFSLVEMLVGMAFISMIAIPNIGSINNIARYAAARRDADPLA